MKRLILCTAGHVDHGKTALVRALTGIDCDTHPEEQRRGITINPGFAFWDLPTGAEGVVRLGIVDVPGHQRFIRNMLAGACGVDFALLVVACDDGVMPQTREHLAILQMLGVRDGVVALSKTDLATPDLVELAREDIRSALVGSFLADAEIVSVSAKAGTGLDDLGAAMARVVGRLPERTTTGPFRMYIDRAFSVAGFGTVVTGSIMSGQVRRDDALRVLPGGQEVKVRRIERHGEEVPVAMAGERASLNLGGITRGELPLGTLLADRPLPATARVDVELSAIDAHTALEKRTQALFFSGTHETVCHVRLLGAERLAAGETALAQIDLEKPAILIDGDRFVLRSASADTTLGGGRCVDAAPLHHRRPTAAVIDQVRKRASGELASAMVAEGEKRMGFVTTQELAAVLGAVPADVRAELNRIPPAEGVLVLAVDDQAVLLGRIARQRMTKIVRSVVEQYHRNDPLGTRGVSARQVATKLEDTGAGRIEVLVRFLDVLAGEGQLKKTEHGGYVLPGYVSKSAQAMAEAARHLLSRLAEAGTTVPPVSELEQEITTRFGLAPKDCKAVLKHLVDEGQLLAGDDGYLLPELVARCRDRLVAYLAAHPEGVTVAGFRDLVDGNRKLCLMLLALYDREGTTFRQGDTRVLTEKGRALAGRC